CPDQVHGPVKEARVARLRALEAQKRETFYQQHCGTEQKVLFEGIDEQSGLLKGFSENYIPVRCQGMKERADVVGCVVPVRLIQVQDEVVLGEITVS
ncbi:MAG: hypothetical protein D3908_16840, partial [Candidatus Electrothrix sp. AUS4]|nr:hypothetical protein [Candidatus Electrothrix sp. AUS4]